MRTLFVAELLTR